MACPLYAKIDLTTGKVSDFPISHEYFSKYIGGKCLGARLILDLTRPGLDPLDPEAVFIVNTGPLNGTGSPSSSRFNMTFKNVLTGGIASSNCGGQFGVMMKKAGYDGLIITGRAASPVLIDITDGEITIQDASSLWGLDAEETQEKLPGMYGKLVIGQAGENLVRYASAASGERMGGRCGCGAVMGSKNLKAIIAYGTKAPEIAHPKKFKKFLKKWIRFIKKHPMTGQSLPRYGSAGLVNKANATHALPTHNFKYGHFENADKFSGETLAETALTRNSGCISCPIRCERRVNVDGKEVKGPEYETLGLFGANIDADNLDFILRVNYLADKLCLDTISLGSTLAFAMELREHGLKDFGVKFGDVSNLEEIIQKIVRREGIYCRACKRLKMAEREIRRKRVCPALQGAGNGLIRATAQRGHGPWLRHLQPRRLPLKRRLPCPFGIRRGFVHRPPEPKQQAAACCVHAGRTGGGIHFRKLPVFRTDIYPGNILQAWPCSPDNAPCW